VDDAEYWFNFARNHFQSEIENDFLYLISRCRKTTFWSHATYAPKTMKAKQSPTMGMMLCKIKQYSFGIRKARFVSLPVLPRCHTYPAFCLTALFWVMCAKNVGQMLAHYGHGSSGPREVIGKQNKSIITMRLEQSYSHVSHGSSSSQRAVLPGPRCMCWDSWPRAGIGGWMS